MAPTPAAVLPVVGGLFSTWAHAFFSLPHGCEHPLESSVHFRFQWDAC